MALEAGRSLGGYEIVELLGSGGMGEVYRARDSRLSRNVAIKILPEIFTTDADRLARFNREALVLASLNHPNIATIHGAEHWDGVHAIVLELVEGVTLADRLAEGRLPLGEAMAVARQLCAALDAAHERGIIHRDLKPANIKLRPDGTVKVLDFGLAKALEGIESPQTSASTMTSPAQTGIGVLLGTAAYMSPEQARGRTVDRRTDIWSFGVVLYEMLAGRPPFMGETVTEVLSAILRDDPDWTQLQPATPSRVRTLLRRCLEKDPAQRLRDIGDARWELDQPPESPLVPARARAWLPWTVAAALAALLAIGWYWWRPREPASTHVAFSITPPPGVALTPVGGLASAPEISPDGSAVLFLTRGALYLRRLNAMTAVRVPGTEPLANAFFWSADSASVVFPTLTGELIRLPLPDGPPQRIAKVPVASRGGSWSDRGTLLLAADGLMMVPAGGGELTPVKTPAMRPGRYFAPEFLPGGDDILFLFAPVDTDEREIYLARLQDDELREPTLLFKNDTAARYTPAGGGRMLFVRNDNLYAQRFNVGARRLEGDPELLVEGIASQPGSQIYRADFSVSRSGAIARRPGRAALAEVTTFDRAGKRLDTRPVASVQSLILSPDQGRLLATGSERSWVVDVGQTARIALPLSAVRWFGWSAEGTRLVGLERQTRLVERMAEGSGDVREIATSSVALGVPQDISRDGRSVLAMRLGGAGVLALKIDGPERGAQNLVEAVSFVASPRFSPDGQWVVYEAGERGNAALYVQPYGRAGRRRQIAPRGRYPEWRGDGREIVFIDGAEVWSLPVAPAGDDLRFGAPQRLFSGLRLPAGLTLASRPLAVSQDGSRVFFPQGVEQPSAAEIHIDTIWPGR